MSEEDVGSKFWNFVYAFGVVIILIILVVVSAYIFFTCDFVGTIMQNRQEEIDKITVIHEQTITYNGTLSTLTYQYGYWGSVDTTKAVFLDGHSFVFGSQLIASLGEDYTVEYLVKTFQDGHFEVTPISINNLFPTVVPPINPTPNPTYGDSITDLWENQGGA